jgi:hypothetical protein
MVDQKNVGVAVEGQLDGLFRCINRGADPSDLRGSLNLESVQSTRIVREVGNAKEVVEKTKQMF